MTEPHTKRRKTSSGFVGIDMEELKACIQDRKEKVLSVHSQRLGNFLFLDNTQSWEEKRGHYEEAKKTYEKESLSVGQAATMKFGKDAMKSLQSLMRQEDLVDGCDMPGCEHWDFRMNPEDRSRIIDLSLLPRLTVGTKEQGNRDFRDFPCNHKYCRSCFFKQVKGANIIGKSRQGTTLGFRCPICTQWYLFDLDVVSAAPASNMKVCYYNWRTLANVSEGPANNVAKPRSIEKLPVTLNWPEEEEFPAEFRV